MSCSGPVADQSEQKEPKQKDDVDLLYTHDSLWHLVLTTDSTENKWEIPYPTFNFQKGDIDENGTEDFMVGVIKRTRFDSTFSKRIFIFKNYRGLIRPLWMGSRLGQPLEDFRFVESTEGSRIRSIEIERSGKYLVAEYKWKKFGLDFVQYLSREVELEDAYLIFNNNP